MSKQSLPRRSLILGGAALSATCVAVGSSTAAVADPAFQLTRHGRAFVALLPDDADATWDDCHVIDLKGAPGYDEANVARINDRATSTHSSVESAIEAVLEAARLCPTAHLGDLAAVLNFRVHDAYCMEDIDYEVVQLLTGAIMSLGGIDPQSCDEAALYEAAGLTKAGTIGSRPALHEQEGTDHT